MFKKLVPAVFFLLAFTQIFAQEVSIKIIDSKTGEGLPQATISINDSDELIADAEGKFILPLKFKEDNTRLNVSYLGYQALNTTIANVKAGGNIVRLSPVMFQLNEVAVDNTNILQPDTIMARVKRNLLANYKNTPQARKSTIFYRESSVFKPIQAKAEMSKSTKIDKKDLKSVNDELRKFSSEIFAHPPQETTDILIDYYSALKTVKDKPVYHTKAAIVKAVKFNEDRKAQSLEEIEKKGMAILMRHLDSTKLYRIKSGIFGTRDTVIGYKPKLPKSTTPNLNYAKSTVSTFASQNSISNGRQINFVSNPELYTYTLAGTVPYGDDGYVYKIKFSPRKRKAKYVGTLFVSPVDYAVVRADYDLAEGKTTGGINLKLILGIKQIENVSRGTLVYKERKQGGYYLQYGSKEEGQYVYINRPLKFIEITDDNKEKVAYDLKAEVNFLDKREYLNISRNEITEAEFDGLKEEEFTYAQPDNYNPAVWNEHSSVNPLKEMQRLKEGL